MDDSQVKRRAELGVPSLGADFNDDEDPFLFCSDLAYTLAMLLFYDVENLGRLDNDVSTYTQGIGGDVNKASEDLLISRSCIKWKVIFSMFAPLTL
ncbi:hypothetical protein FN846DRAFT_910892 [Sphaerosporella brunnea]|uniref:Uncharacterized protein n=1 Tax=Sphaerosporella brunnea TaxID=1250544 RepID=A0A5J5EMH9_9PEZI|nr:hypothetical protein FN846DRAFT_910892 [Sphaerosporella brunnea]